MLHAQVFSHTIRFSVPCSLRACGKCINTHLSATFCMYICLEAVYILTLNIARTPHPNHTDRIVLCLRDHHCQHDANTYGVQPHDWQPKTLPEMANFEPCRSVHQQLTRAASSRKGALTSHIMQSHYTTVRGQDLMGNVLAV